MRRGVVIRRATVAGGYRPSGPGYGPAVTERWTITVGATNLPDDSTALDAAAFAADPDGPVAATSAGAGPLSVHATFTEIAADLEEEAVQEALDRFGMIPGSSGWDITAEIEDDRPA